MAYRPQLAGTSLLHGAGRPRARVLVALPRVPRGGSARDARPVFLGFRGLGGLGATLDPSTVATIRNVIISTEGAPAGTTNPGNLRYIGPTELGFPVTQDANGFAVFPNYAAGVQALDTQIQIYADAGMTIQSMMNTYAPAGDGNNDPAAYAQKVAAALGVDPSTSLASVDSTSSVYTLPFGVDFSGAADDLTAAFNAPDLSSAFTIVENDPVLMVGGLVLAGLLLYAVVG